MALKSIGLSKSEIGEAGGATKLPRVQIEPIIAAAAHTTLTNFQIHTIKSLFWIGLETEQLSIFDLQRIALFSSSTTSGSLILPGK